MEELHDNLSFQALLESGFEIKSLNKAAKIATFISNLPTEKTLKKFCKTEDLQFFWLQLRSFYRQIAECFAVLSLQNKIEDCNLELKDLFEGVLNQKSIKRRDLELYELESKRLIAEWNLIEIGFPHLIAELKNFQFYEDISLFLNILEYQTVQPIKQRASGYYEISMSSRAKVFEQTYVATREKNEDRNKLLKNPLVHRYALKEEVIELLQQKAFEDQCIKQKLEALQTVHNDLALTASESCNARNSSGKYLKFEVWKNGERYLFTKQGLKKFPYIEELRAYLSEFQLKTTKLALQHLVHTS